MTKLKGITWNHTRVFCQQLPMHNVLANSILESKSIGEKFTGICRCFYRRLSKGFDLLVNDYPWTGFGANSNVILLLSDHLSSGYIKDRGINTVGRSYGSYLFLSN